MKYNSVKKVQVLLWCFHVSHWFLSSGASVVFSVVILGLSFMLKGGIVRNLNVAECFDYDDK